MGDVQENLSEQVAVDEGHSGTTSAAPEKGSSLIDRYRELYGIDIKIRICSRLESPE